MLLSPIAVAWTWARPAPLAAALFVVAAVCAFLAQYAATALLQHRPASDVRWWLAAELVGLALSGTSLVAAHGGGALLLLAAAGTGLFGAGQTLWELGGAHPLRKTAGELARIGAIALSGPAAFVVSCGRIEAPAGLLYAACLVSFSAVALATR